MKKTKIKNYSNFIKENNENDKMVTVVVPFVGIEECAVELHKLGIYIKNVDINPSTNFIPEATLEGKESVIRMKIAELWDLNPDSEEIDELFFED